MKKTILLFLGFLVASHLQAQHCDSINNHSVEGFNIIPCIIPSNNPSFQLADGNILLVTEQDTRDENGIDTHPYSTKYYKITRQGATIIDSVSYENHQWDKILVARIHENNNPAFNQYCNVLVRVLNDTANCKADLNLSFFDDDIHFNEAMEVTVPLADTIINIYYYQTTHCLLDSNNDIIFQYGIPTRDETHFDRFGLDGTLKHKTIIPRSVISINYDYNVGQDELVVQGLKQCSESPVYYNLYGTLGYVDCNLLFLQGAFMVYVLDSQFNIANTITILPTDPNSYPYIHNSVEINGIESLDDGSTLVARNKRIAYDLQTTGIVKYDAYGNIIKQTWFDISDVQFDPYLGFPIDTYTGVDLQKDGNGNVYYAFQCAIDHVSFITIAKLDEDLNLLWVRYGMQDSPPHTIVRDGYRFGLTLLDHGGAVVFGINYNFDGTVLTNEGWFMMLVDDADYGVTETDRSIRPYLFYPNPVEDRLNIHYSPDVKPLKVELLDLQGRLLATQRANLESIDMQSLPAGTYTMRVVLDNGKTYSDKIIKQ